MGCREWFLKIPAVIENVLIRIAAPVTAFFPLSVSLFLFFSGIGLLSALGEDIRLVIYTLFHALLLTYVVMLAVFAAGHRWRRIILGFVILISLPFFAGDVFAFTLLGRPIGANEVAVIMGSNTEEAASFFKTYSVVKPLLFSLCAVALIVCVYFLMRPLLKYIFRSGKVKAVLGLLIFAALFLGIYFSVKYPKIWGSTSSIEKIIYFLSVEQADLSETAILPRISYLWDESPDNIVLIIGESFSRSHSSLYGYRLPTNPRLQRLAERGELFVFTDVIAAGVPTIRSFKRMMSSYEGDPDDDWRSQVFLPDVFKFGFYRTLWVSNQSKLGFYDNVVTSFARLFDYMVFTSDTGEDAYDNGHGLKYDGALLPLLSSVLEGNSAKQSFYLVHLLGSHFAFSERYPAEWSRFKAPDYPGADAATASAMAAYDNSVYYNDFVTDSIIGLFRDKNAAVIYLSDHALNYGNEGFYNGDSSLVEIPFMIYLSPVYREKYPQMEARIVSALGKPFMTGDLLYTAMDLAGLLFTVNDDVAEHSLLSPDRKPKKRIPDINGRNFDYDK